MLRLLIFIVLGIVVYRAIKGHPEDRPGRQDPIGGRAPIQVDDDMIKDPVCGSYFPARDAVTIKNNGRALLFCSHECRDRYIKEQADRS